MAEVREGEYGDRVVAVEPGGAEFIPLSERHGNPLQLFWTWMSPNLEFATVFVGVIAVAVLRADLLAGVARHRARHRRWDRSRTACCRPAGREFGVPQMILSRIPFGCWGNMLPAGLNAVDGGHRVVRGQQRERRLRARRR